MFCFHTFAKIFFKFHAFVPKLPILASVRAHTHTIRNTFTFEASFSAAISYLDFLLGRVRIKSSIPSSSTIFVPNCCACVKFKRDVNLLAHSVVSAMHTRCPLPHEARFYLGWWRQLPDEAILLGRVGGNFHMKPGYLGGEGGGGSLRGNFHVGFGDF